MQWKGAVRKASRALQTDVTCCFHGRPFCVATSLRVVLPGLSHPREDPGVPTRHQEGSATGGHSPGLQDWEQGALASSWRAGPSSVWVRDIKGLALTSPRTRAQDLGPFSCGNVVFVFAKLLLSPLSPRTSEVL